jgi:branched-chain amino acid transport system permease protein
MNKKSYLYKIYQSIVKVLKTPSFRYILIGLIMLYLAFNLSGGKKDAIISTAIYFIVGLGFTLLLGYAGLASLGTAGFMAIGVYLFGILNDRDLYGLPAPLVFLIILGIGLVLGLVIGFISLRIEGIFLAIVTLGLSEIVVEIMKNLARMLTGVERCTISTSALWFGDQNIPIYADGIKYLTIFLMIVVMILIANIMKSATGRAMLSLKNSQSAGQMMGMSLLKYRLSAFVISTILASLGGILFMSYYHYTEPIDWGLTTSLLILAAVVIGGAKSIIGVLLGTVAVFTINTLFLQQITFFRENSNFINIFTGILIIVIVMFFPGGLYHLGLILKMKFIDLKKKIVEKLNKSKLERKEQYYGKDEEYRPFETISY